jgi:nucleotide-binding universal stress UspA family protein
MTVKKILIAIDHASMNEALLQEVLFMAKAEQAEVMLLHVLSSEEEDSPIRIPVGAETMYWPAWSDFNLEVWREQWKTYASECLEKLQSLATKVRQSGLNVEFRQLVGSPGRVICEFAESWGAELIVMGNQGRSGLKELVLGSVSNYVLHHTSRSVLIVKTPAITESSKSTIGLAIPSETPLS